MQGGVGGKPHPSRHLKMADIDTIILYNGHQIIDKNFYNK